MIITTHAVTSTIPFPFTPASWTAVGNSTFGSSNIFKVVYNPDDGEYLAAGSGGKIAKSINVVDWASQAGTFGTSSIYALEYGDGRYIAGGSIGKMSTSTNGVNWSEVNSSFGASVILSIAYAPNIGGPGGTWIAVGGSGKLATSIDGLSWVQRLSSFGISFIRSLHVTDSLIVAVGDEGKLATSTDGVNWTQRFSAFDLTSIYDVAARGTEFMAVGDSGKISISNGGTSWSQVFPQTTFVTSSIRAVAVGDEGNDPFVAAGAAGKIATSFDKFVWVQRVSQFGSSGINDLYVGPNTAIAVGNSGKISYSI
jgi:hypothetical protein